MPKKPRATLCLDEYDCIGFDLDHTLCRYNVGPMIRLEYDLLAEFLVAKKGYNAAIRAKPFDADRHLVCKGLTLDCDKGNLLRLGHDGFILGKYSSIFWCEKVSKILAGFFAFLLQKQEDSRNRMEVRTTVVQRTSILFLLSSCF